MLGDDIYSKPRRFTTEELPERDRLSRWREVFGKTLVRVEIEPVEADEPFRVEATLQELPGAKIAELSGSTARLDRTRALAADGGDFIALIVNTGATALVGQRDAELVLGKGAGVFLRTYEPGLLCCSDHSGILLPRAALAMRANDVESLVMKPVRHDDCAMRLLLSYLKLLRADADMRRPPLQQAVMSHIHELAALAMGANRDTRQEAASAVAAGRLAAATDYIARSFANLDLTLADVARHAQISPRYLQELLEKSGASFTARVNELRLKRAMSLLIKFPERPVSVIAAQVGFSNVPHFNRVFRQRFGDSPSAVRGRA